MANYKITLQRFLFRSQDAPSDHTVIVYRSKDSIKKADNEAQQIAEDLYGITNGEGKVIYTIEELPEAG